MLREFFRGGFGTWVAVWLAPVWVTLLTLSSRIEPLSRSLLYWAALLVWTVIVLAVWGAIVKATSGIR
jgi:hypothetical protein